MYPGNPEKAHVKFSTELKGHAAPIEKVAFNPTKDAELASVSSDGVVKFWDVRTKACFNEVTGLGDAFTLAWAPDGQSLIVGNKVFQSTLSYRLLAQVTNMLSPTTSSSSHLHNLLPFLLINNPHKPTKSPSAGAAPKSSSPPLKAALASYPTRHWSPC